jgi:hypothetical protein
VVASEFAFLVLGLILGIPTGVALLVVLHARPARSTQVRVTVAPDSVPRRRSATLADDPFAERHGTPARGGPADTGRGPGNDGTVQADPMTDVLDSPSGRSIERTGFPIPRQIRTSVLSTAGAAAGASVGFAVPSGVDPLFASFQRAPAAGRPARALTGGRDGTVAVAESATPTASAARAASGIALVEAAIAARDAERPAGSTLRAAADDSHPTQGGASESGPEPHLVAAAATDPCAADRRAMTEACALAERMRNQAESAADRLRQAQRTYDAHVGAADQAEAIADPRVQRAAKDAAQHAFRRDRGRAGSREEVETAARTWLQEINRINGAAREAAARLTQERRAATAQVSTIERLTVAADAVRVQAEAALDACLHAREALAECEEARVAEPPAARMPLAPSLAPGEAPPDPLPAPELPLSPAALMARALRTQPLADDAEAEALAATLARGDGQPAILRLLAGDRTAFERLVAALGGDDPAERRRWQAQLAGLIDALVARAIDACAFDFPEDHPFWGPFNRGQCRDIALALSSLGFRFDGLGGFADERVPSQRDLSLATGYAGLDPMRIRRWPSEAEMADLFQDVTVAADEYIAGAAAGLTLGELVTLLGHRADGLTEVWNAWGRIRPRLLEPI